MTAATWSFPYPQHEYVCHFAVSTRPNYMRVICINPCSQAFQLAQFGKPDPYWVGASGAHAAPGAASPTARPQGGL